VSDLGEQMQCGEPVNACYTRFSERKSATARGFLLKIRSVCECAWVVGGLVVGISKKFQFNKRNYRGCFFSFGLFFKKNKKIKMFS